MALVEPRGPYTKMTLESQINGSLANTDSSLAFKILLERRLDCAFSAQVNYHAQGFTHWRLDLLEMEIPPAKAVPNGDWGVCVKTDPLLPDPGTTQKAIGYKPSVVGPLKNKLVFRFKPADRSFKYRKDVVSTTDDRLESYGDMFIFSELADAAYTAGLPYFRKIKVTFATQNPFDIGSDSKFITGLQNVVGSKPVLEIAKAVKNMAFHKAAEEKKDPLTMPYWIVKSSNSQGYYTRVWGTVDMIPAQESALLDTVLSPNDVVIAAHYPNSWGTKGLYQDSVRIETDNNNNSK